MSFSQPNRISRLPYGIQMLFVTNPNVYNRENLEMLGAKKSTAPPDSSQPPEFPGYLPGYLPASSVGIIVFQFFYITMAENVQLP